MTTPSDDFKVHEGLIELDPTKHTKNYLDPQTGVSNHSLPWKSTHSDDEDDGTPQILKPPKEGTVKRALVGMSVGGAALAPGTAMKDQIERTLETKERIPQQAGDCLAGEVTNESPTCKLSRA